MAFPLNDFELKATELEHSKEYLKEIRKYVSNLEKNNLPVIFSLPHLCLLAGVNVRIVVDFCESNRIEDYKRFKLRKRKGGFRIILTPPDEIKYLQRWILHNILNEINSHNSCKGFDRSSSIKKNAEVHINKEAILKIDLLRYFDSINEERIYGVFKSFGYHPNLAVSLSKLCTIVPNDLFFKSFKKKESKLKTYLLEKQNGILPQGSPASPKLSNLIARRLSKLALSKNIAYSRYADDLTFSGNLEDLKTIKKIIIRIIKDENFFINNSKTKILIRGNPFFVTGLSVVNNIVAIPKKRKIDIEHHLYHCIKNGVEAHLNISGITKRNFKDWLLGNIAFVFSVEEELGKKYFAEFNKIQWPI